METVQLDNTTNTPKWEPYSSEELTLWAILLSVVGIATCILNVICVVAILRGKLHKEENKFLFMLSLAVSDSVYGFLQFVLAVIRRSMESHSLCFISTMLLDVTISVDILSLILLTTDTFLLIELHMKYHVYATRRNAYLALTGLLIVCLMEVIIIANLYSYNTNVKCDYIDMYPTWYHLCSAMFYFLIPLIAIMGMHLRIFHISRLQLKKMSVVDSIAPQVRLNGGEVPITSTNVTGQVGNQGGNPPLQGSVELFNIPSTMSDRSNHGQHSQNDSGTTCPTGQNSRTRRHWKAVITLTILIGKLFCTWVPANIASILDVFVPDLYGNSGYIGRLLMDNTDLLYMLNPLLNPLIYIVRMPRVKREIRKFIPRM